MQESFSNSAGRHLQDAQLLLAEQRWDNAVYLAGYVVECSFKVLGSDKYVVIRYSLAQNIVVMMNKIPNSTNMVF